MGIADEELTRFTELLDTADAGPSAPDVDPVERARRRRRRLRAGITTAVVALVLGGGLYALAQLSSGIRREFPVTMNQSVIEQMF